MRICTLSEAGDLLLRSTQMASGVEAQVAAIVSDVATRGDIAVADITTRIEGRPPLDATTLSYEIARAAWHAQAATVAAPVRAALELAADRIATFHRLQLPPHTPTELTHRGDGLTLQLKTLPLDRVGLYVPGGTARYPSSVLMATVPAKLAGVGEIIMVTPSPSPETLAAAVLSGVDRVFALGGAQAIAALAYGTATVPRVDKIVGPGNQWVAAAKRQVFGQVDIDSVAGPTEVLIIADDKADPAWVAADLLAQAEHDVVAQAIAVVLSEPFARRVAEALEAQLQTLPRAEIARASLRNRGAVVVAPDVAAAIEFANRYAPEHLSLHLPVATARAWVPRIRHAGAVFVGPFASEAAGDYVAGTNHVLPTGGSARFSSPLGVYDFQKRLAVIEYTAEAAARDAAAIEALADVEGLAAHGRAAGLRRTGHGGH